MNNNRSTRALTESSMMAALTIVLMLITYNFPILGYVTMFVCPLPIATVYIKHGKKYCIMALIVASVVAGIINGEPVSAISMLLFFGSSSIVLGYCIENKKPSHITIVYMAVAMFISVLILVKGMELISGKNIVQMLVDAINTALETAKQTASSMNMTESEISSLYESLDANMLVAIIPAAMAFSTLFSAFVSYLIAQKLFKRFGYNISPIKKFSTWYIPTPMVVIVIIAIAAAYIAHSYKGSGADAYFNNAYLVFQLMFLINGLCAADYFLINRKIPTALRVIICIMLLSLSYITIIIGLIDNSLNLRKLDKSRIRRV